MTLSRIFLLCFALGIAGGVWWSRGAAPPTLKSRPTPESDAPPLKSHVSPEHPLIAKSSKPTASVPKTAAKPPAPLPARPPVDAAATQEERSKAEELASAEPFTPEDVRTLLEKVLAGKLVRELSASDYDRLADAVLRVRAAERVLKGVDETVASAAVRAEQRDIISEAITEVEDITGLEPSALNKVVDPQADITEEANDELLLEPQAR